MILISKREVFPLNGVRKSRAVGDNTSLAHALNKWREDNFQER